MRDSYDVIVVGAGPAGASAAYHAAMRGLSTLLVDRKTFPRVKICGDGLTPRAVGALVKMRLGDLCDRHVRIGGVRLVAGDNATESRYASAQGAAAFGLVVPRSVLDAEIAAAAVRAGATFVQDARVISALRDRNESVAGVVVNHAGGLSRVRASVTVVADGATGRLSRLLCPRAKPIETGWAARQYLANVRSLEPVFEVHAPVTFRGERLPGYAWIFPVTTTDANVGVGVFDGITSQVSVADVLAAFVAWLMRRDRRFAGAHRGSPIEGGAVSVRMLDPRRTPDGALLVGDAAGLVNPYTGEGIAAALESGELAAEAVARTVQGHGPASAWYTRRLRSRFRRSWALRDAAHHVQWLYEGAGVAVTERVPLIAALRAVALDDRRAPAPGDGPFGGLTGTDVVRRVGEAAASHLAARLRRTDVVLAEVVAELLRDPASPAVDPLVIGAAVASGGGQGGRAFVDGILALATFVLAQDLVTHVAADGNDAAQAGDVAAITLADCLLTEAAHMLTGLPQEVVRAISRAASLSAAARREGLAECRSVGALRERYAALAAPTACAADLAARALGLSESAARARRAFAEWYAVTRQAVRDLSRESEAGTHRTIAQRVALRAPPAVPDGMALEDLALRLCDAARRVTAVAGITDGSLSATP